LVHLFEIKYPFLLVSQSIAMSCIGMGGGDGDHGWWTLVVEDQNTPWWLDGGCIGVF
jgi:hypothetical protein